MESKSFFLFLSFCSLLCWEGRSGDVKIVEREEFSKRANFRLTDRSKFGLLTKLSSQPQKVIEGNPPKMAFGSEYDFGQIILTQKLSEKQEQKHSKDHSCFLFMMNPGYKMCEFIQNAHSVLLLLGHPHFVCSLFNLASDFQAHTYISHI